MTSAPAEAEAPAIIIKEEDDAVNADALDADDGATREGRSENSLAYLCQRFCELYGNPAEPINIDLAAKELGIQRRRMYEILNIIQSVGLVTRLRASFYRWEGYATMTSVLERLKDEGLRRLGPSAVSSSSAAAASSPSLASASAAVVGLASPDGQRKKAVATALGERFVQIFLCNEAPQPIILEDIMGLFSSCVGVGGTPTNQLSCARRLYDIANVFCAVGLVKKLCSPATDTRRKKRLYAWTGPVAPTTATPMRLSRQQHSAPTASPNSGSAKRVRREPSRDGHASPRAARKKGKRINVSPLEASIRRVEEDQERQQRDQERDKDGDAKREVGEGHEMLPIKILIRPPTVMRGRAIATDTDTTTTGTAGDAATAPTTMTPAQRQFNPPNAKDSGDDAFDGLLPAPHLRRRASTGTCATCASRETPACVVEVAAENRALRSRVDELTRAIETAATREKELLVRLALQETQINKLVELHATGGALDLRRPLPPSSRLPKASAPSPISSWILSPFSSAVSPFAGGVFPSSGVLASGGPASASAVACAAGGLSSAAHPSNNSTNSTTSARRPPSHGRKARIGPQIVDPAGDDDPKSTPRTRPLPSTPSSLLLSPLGPATGDRDKENRLDRLLATPPCHLLATAASSLLSLTPTQIPSFSPAIREFCGDHDADDPLASASASSSSGLKVMGAGAAPASSRSTPSPVGSTTPAPPLPPPTRRSCVVGFDSPASLTSAFESLSPLRAPRVSDCLSR